MNAADSPVGNGSSQCDGRGRDKATSGDYETKRVPRTSRSDARRWSVRLFLSRSGPSLPQERHEGQHTPEKWYVHPC